MLDMRNIKPVSVALALALSAASGHAADITPGLWEFTITLASGAPGGATPPPFRSTQCYGAEDARDPSRLLGKATNPGADCKYVDRNYSGNTFTFRMQCTGVMAMESAGRIDFSAEKMDGTVESKANMMGQAIEMRNNLTARRVGSC
jgi:hypothetical protein